jgi:hypothetical protein
VRVSRTRVPCLFAPRGPASPHEPGVIPLVLQVNTIFRYECPWAPVDQGARNETQLWVPVELRPYHTRTNCVIGAVVYHGPHHPAIYPEDILSGQKLVSLFREPAARVRSCWAFLHAMLHGRCAPRSESTDPHHPPNPILVTHGMPPDFYRIYLSRNCTFPVEWAQSEPVWAQISGIQAKTVLGLPLKYAAPVAQAQLNRMRFLMRNHFALVGLSEHFHASICLFHARLLARVTPQRFELARFARISQEPQ